MLYISKKFLFILHLYGSGLFDSRFLGTRGGYPKNFIAYHPKFLNEVHVSKTVHLTLLTDGPNPVGLSLCSRLQSMLSNKFCRIIANFIFKRKMEIFTVFFFGNREFLQYSCILSIPFTFLKFYKITFFNDIS